MVTVSDIIDKNDRYIGGHTEMVNFLCTKCRSSVEHKWRRATYIENGIEKEYDNDLYCTLCESDTAKRLIIQVNHYSSMDIYELKKKEREAAAKLEADINKRRALLTPQPKPKPSFFQRVGNALFGDDLT